MILAKLQSPLWILPLYSTGICLTCCIDYTQPIKCALFIGTLETIFLVMLLSDVEKDLQM